MYRVIQDVGIINFVLISKCLSVAFLEAAAFNSVCSRCVVCKWWREWKMDQVCMIPHKFLIGQWDMDAEKQLLLRNYKIDLSSGFGINHRMCTGLLVVWIEYLYWQECEIAQIITVTKSSFTVNSTHHIILYLIMIKRALHDAMKSNISWDVHLL